MMATNISSYVLEDARDVLQIIVDSLTEKGRPPTLREIGELAHMSHPTVLRRVRILEDLEFITRQPKKARGIKVLVSQESYQCRVCGRTTSVPFEELPDECPECSEYSTWASV